MVDSGRVVRVGRSTDSGGGDIKAREDLGDLDGLLIEAEFETIFKSEPLHTLDSQENKVEPVLEKVTSQDLEAADDLGVGGDSPVPGHQCLLFTPDGDDGPEGEDLDMEFGGCLEYVFGHVAILLPTVVGLSEARKRKDRELFTP